MYIQKLNFSDNRHKKLEDCLLYFDYFNSRLKILKYNVLSNDLTDEILRHAKRENLGKVIINCREEDLDVLKKAGFVVEGVINGFFRGKDAQCVSFFIDKERAQAKRVEEKDKILKMCMDKIPISQPEELKEGYQLIDCGEKEIPQMIEIFKDIFKTYPSPVFDANYLKKMIKEKMLFKAILKNGKIISIASADMDEENLNAEITDCATYPEYRGQGLLTNLIYSLENDIRKKGYYTLYSLSRAINPGINILLRKQGYHYKGRLINNSNICGGFEDMNIWVKNIIN